ncbi:MAG: hypothetical protein H3Z54_01225 [archaeon]|nr:hypothetical protein [archaeon]
MFNIKRKKKGISPVIASIILIAITIAVAIAVAGWVFGLFGTYGSAGGVSVINPTLTIGAVDDTFAATVKNDKDTGVSIVSVTATGDLGVAITFDFTGSGPYTAHSSGPITATATTGNFTSGSPYTIRIAFSDGTIVSASASAI